MKFFKKFMDFLLVSICDEELVDDALLILHNFLVAPNLKFKVYDDQECREFLVKSIKLLYDGTSKPCKDKFKAYLETKVAERTEDTDNALKKFFKSIILKLSEDHNETYSSSNLTDVMDKLN